MSDGSNILRNTFSMRTGVAHLRALPPPLLLDLAFQKGSSEVLVTPLAHEIIHHACANTSVNVALQYRWLELLRLMISSPTLGVAIYDDEIELAAQLAAAEAVLQPLAEGIAHFSEFDCVVPESRMGRGYMLGPTDALTWRLIAMKGTGNHLDELFGQLKSEQLDARTIKRKTDVLCNPVHPRTGNDTYLLGYLLIKSLWNKFIAGVKDSRLRAPSFLNFVMYYIYEDWELARIILTSGRASHEPIVERVADRLKNLFKCDLVAQVAAFTDDMDERVRQRGTLKRGPEEREHGAFKGLDLSKDEVIAGMRAMIRFQSDRVAPGAALAPQQKIQGLTNAQHLAMMIEMDPAEPHVAELLHRHRVVGSPTVRLLDFVLDIPQEKRAFCYLMDVPVEIRGQNGTHLLISSPVDPAHVCTIQAPAASAFSNVAQSGRLFGVITSTDIPWRFYCFLMQESQVVCTWSHGGGVEDVQEFQRLARTISAEVQIEGLTGFSFVGLNDFIMRNEQVQQRVGQKADTASVAMVEKLRSILSGAGWSGLLDLKVKNDFGLANIFPKGGVKSLAAASICSAFSSDQHEMESLMREAGFTLPSVVELSAKIKKDMGVTLMRSEGNRIYVHV